AIADDHIDQYRRRGADRDAIAVVVRGVDRRREVVRIEVSAHLVCVTIEGEPGHLGRHVVRAVGGLGVGAWRRVVTTADREDENEWGECANVHTVHENRARVAAADVETRTLDRLSGWLHGCDEPIVVGADAVGTARRYGADAAHVASARA